MPSISAREVLRRAAANCWPPCGGVAGRCAVYVAFLHGWRNCLAGATATLICSRGAEVAELQTCDL